MYHYLFTNDLRIVALGDVLRDAGNCFITDTVPLATEDKSKNNNYMTLGFYFNLAKNTRCAAACAHGDIRKVVLNFIKKFQFPNPRTTASLEDCINDGIMLAPMRMVLKILYLMKITNMPEQFLSRGEIAKYIMFNDSVAKTESADLTKVLKEICDDRASRTEDLEVPTEEELNSQNCYWKHCERQIREMIKILCWSGCVVEDDNGKVSIKHDRLTRDNEADIFEIISCNTFWHPDPNGNANYNKDSYQKYMDLEDYEVDNEDVSAMNIKLKYSTGLQTKYPLNRIIFGAPGTGKSFTINQERKDLLGENNEDDYERVTFHPDYSYANFVGTYKPVPCVDGDGKDSITYEYVPGPFMRMYVKALKNAQTDNPKPHLLIIEEINRANVAAVFGDVFQLLDRDDDGVSEYPIQASEDMKKYLAKELGGDPDEYSKIRLPDNMFIWATMNSADQGVFPMDTAFKRRWDFTYLGIDDNDKDIQGKYVTIGSKEKQRIEWNELRKSINEFLAKEKINEDKQLGPYFIARSIVVPADGGSEIDSKKFCDVFKHKVLMYLFEDAARQKRPKLFEGSAKGQTRYSKICEAFDEQGIGIFHPDIQNRVTIHDLAINGHELDENGMLKAQPGE